MIDGLGPFRPLVETWLLHRGSSILPFVHRVAFRDGNGGSADKADFCISFQVANSLLSSTPLPAAERLSY